MRDEPALERAERRQLGWSNAIARDDRGDLDDRVVAEERQRSVVSEIDHVPAGAGGPEEARDQLDRRLRVAGAAALLQELGFLVETLVGVELEQLALDLRDDLRARPAVLLLVDDLVVLVEVVQVIG